jgi:hypothetical protein
MRRIYSNFRLGHQPAASFPAYPLGVDDARCNHLVRDGSVLIPLVHKLRAGSLFGCSSVARPMVGSIGSFAP